tara:strand:- start:1776 stop:1997 length:222 start_codon:yes stop_codon:yes gene_type:complete
MERRRQKTPDATVKSRALSVSLGKPTDIQRVPDTRSRYRRWRSVSPDGHKNDEKKRVELAMKHFFGEENDENG